MAVPERELARVQRQLRLPGFGLEEQRALRNTRILVCGAGGLGCPVIQQLAAAGAGRLSIVDHDTIEWSNIHRQVLFGESSIGRSKAEVAAERARELQPDIEVTARVEKITEDNAVALMAGADLVIDGTDNFATKYLIADACEITSTPLVWGSVLRFRGDVALWHSGPHTPDGRGVGLRDLFPTPPESAADCASAGVLGATTSVVGGLMATTAIAWATGLDRQVGRLTSYQALPAGMRSFQVAADPQRPLTETLRGNPLAELLQAVLRGDLTLVDIREDEEVAAEPAPLAVHVPGSRIRSEEEFIEHFPVAGPALIMCAGGVRSKAFVERYGHLAHLSDAPGGYAALKLYF